MSTYAIYFSATENTKKIVESMAFAIDAKTISVDVTVHKKVLNCTKEDFVIIGAPVYAGRIPWIARERFFEIKGNGTPCILVACYGNRDYDDALVEMEDIMKENDFIVYGACAMIGKHTYGSIQVDRPNIKDLEDAKAFALEIFNRYQPMISQVPGNRPYKEGLKKGNFHPTTSDCIHCQICVQNCPVQAISDDCITISDQCVSCFRCIKLCPIQAKEIVNEQYLEFAKKFSERLKERKENKFYL